LGICLGLEAMAIEYPRNKLNLEGATSEEFDEEAPTLVVKLQEEQKRLHGLGGTARLGNWITILEENSRLAQIYGSSKITQRHRHRYEIVSEINFKDFQVVGRDEKTGLIEAMELADHPFYIGVQFHPECCIDKSPLYGALVDAAFERRILTKEKHGSDKSENRKYDRPTTFLENFDLEYEIFMRKLVSFPEKDLAELDITITQRDRIIDFLRTLDEKEAMMNQAESEIKTLELEMREINLDSHHIVGEPLTQKQEQRLDELHQIIEPKKQKMRFMREHNFNALMSFDEAIGRINWQQVKLALSGD
jgi:Glutamine amidotransferase class-I